MLGKRGAKHETVLSAQAVNANTWAEFAPNQRVQTCDGYPGKVIAVQDGPHAGNEAYDVLLDNGMGGGLYTASQLKPINERTAEVHTAVDDYPELGTILVDRPDIAPNQFLGSLKTAEFDPSDHQKACPECDELGYHPGCETCGGKGYVEPQRHQPSYDQWDEHHAPELDGHGHPHLHGLGSSSGPHLHFEAKKRLFPCAYCAANQMGTGQYGQHCQQCPNETPHDLEAHGHTEDQHSKQQLFADMAEHLENCNQMQGLVDKAAAPAGAIPNQPQGPPAPEPSGVNPGASGCPECDAMSTGGMGDGSPGGWSGGGFGSFAALHTQHLATNMIKSAAVDPDFRFHVTASWSDVRNKAKKMRSEGRIRIVAASEGYVAGEVKGDHHIYSTVLQRLPGRQAVAAWECGCTWAGYSWGRTGPWRKFEGRMCSHALGLHLEAQARGMFGRTIQEDAERPAWMRKDSPVVVRWDRDKREPAARRANPPGNMKRVFTGSLEEQDLDIPFKEILAALEADRDTAELLMITAGIPVEGFAFLLPLLGEGLAAGAGEAAAGAAAGEAAGAAGTAGGGAAKFLEGQGGKALQQGLHNFQQGHQAPSQAPQGGMQTDDMESSSGGKKDNYTSIGRVGALTDPTKPALPMTTGEDDEDGMGSITPDLEDDTKVASLAWLDPTREGNSGNSSDIAAAAREFLSKSASKDFSLGEQRMLIDEGAGTRAGNLDRLDIADTHYAMLKDEDDDSWMA